MIPCSPDCFPTADETSRKSFRPASDAVPHHLRLQDLKHLTDRHGSIWNLEFVENWPGFMKDGSSVRKKAGGWVDLYCSGSTIGQLDAPRLWDLQLKLCRAAEWTGERRYIDDGMRPYSQSNQMRVVLRICTSRFQGTSNFSSGQNRNSCDTRSKQVRSKRILIVQETS